MELDTKSTQSEGPPEHVPDLLVEDEVRDSRLGLLDRWEDIPKPILVSRRVTWRKPSTCARWQDPNSRGDLPLLGNCSGEIEVSKYHAWHFPAHLGASAGDRNFVAVEAS